ncbi:MAG TPA: DMT family transporter [Verrucomicrobium sp.]|nr:DMT family transporter [Verrucomicrobium sp.]
MLPAIITAFLFAGAGICGQRAAVGLGSLKANALRLVFAAAALGLISWLTDSVDLTTRTAQRLFYSGVVGFGVGDVALFLAYPRLGARLTLLLYLCSAPLFGAIGDAWFLSTVVTPWQGGMIALILTGVGVALWQGVRLPSPGQSKLFPGVFAALVAGCGQGMGAVLSRMAQHLAREDGLVISGLSQAFVRVLPGMGFALMVWLVSMKLPLARSAAVPPPSRASRRRWWWLLGAASFGPVLGVSCFQWALGETRSAVVLSVTAMTPLIIMPLSAWIDKDRPGWAAALGAILAVSGVIGLNLRP